MEYHHSMFVSQNGALVIFQLLVDYKLIHQLLVTPYGTQILVNNGSDNGLLSEGTKSLPE